MLEGCKSIMKSKYVMEYIKKEICNGYIKAY